MPDKKPTDAEIVKALECCLEASGVNCGKCPYCDNCVTDENTSLMMIDVLDLLNRLQADRENYKQIAENQQKIILDKAFEIKRLKEEIARVHKVIPKMIKTAKAEAYKEFAERLKERKYLDDGWSHGEHPYVVEESDIDEVLEELVGEDNVD